MVHSDARIMFYLLQDGCIFMLNKPWHPLALAPKALYNNKVSGLKEHIQQCSGGPQGLLFQVLRVRVGSLPNQRYILCGAQPSHVICQLCTTVYRKTLGIKNEKATTHYLCPL